LRCFTAWPTHPNRKAARLLTTLHGEEPTAANTDDGVALLLERILARNGGN
jgi:hypothetical protein